ncbi:complement C1q subcomponent subunit A-like [Takifugu rubripes]|uniref:complement C1q subcomponent subunit A-like n=1 Tax=Takifugu rubripes TaxID=31033 RepID=UPI0005D157E1|nr:complement C1q subcomponent subunit A-like [Takifugu rubripes]XP_029682719.1 complement C1q subcomponent subunit A-like [Takifugu rubripes]|eukprot:XP_011615748.1 PREDICTED: complement C1q subcomponent subunit A-like [Takifugu rubripes]
MGCHYGLVVLVGVTLLLTPGHGDPNCKGIAGVAGQPGIPGRDGQPGAKGEKGEPATLVTGDPRVLHRLKGDAGSPGMQGAMGPKGYHGEVGPLGPPGNPGLPGPGGNTAMTGEHVQHTHSAFSVMRTDQRYPVFRKVVTYDVTLVNKPGHFNAGTGFFTCKIPGVYYFTFQSMAKVSMCLRISSDSLTDKLGFCDYNRNTEQVLSGGVVLQLGAGQKVWLESFKDQQKDAETKDTQEKKIIFSGFMIYAE